jgi:hypothetical protein
MKLIVVFLLLFSLSYAQPFDYDLHLTTLDGTNSRTMICFHGSGANYKIAHDLKKLGLESTLISFNFPDHDLWKKFFSLNNTTFGTIDELLPAFYVLKKIVIDRGLEVIDLYGFSAGGGVVINLIALLNSSLYDAHLQQIGITNREKERLLAAIQNGHIILDTPLKSVEEIIEFRGSSNDFEKVAKNYRDNGLRPLDTLFYLEGLSLDIILHFQNPDDMIYNRDDELYIDRLTKANSLGKTSVVIADDGGHLAPHHSLWKHYSQKIALLEANYGSSNSKRR